MKGLRLTIARQTVSSILDTLGDDDFFNIIAVSSCRLLLKNMFGFPLSAVCSSAVQSRDPLCGAVFERNTGPSWQNQQRRESLIMWITSFFNRSFLSHVRCDPSALPGTPGQAVCQRDRAAGRSFVRSLHNPQWCEFHRSKVWQKLNKAWIPLKGVPKQFSWVYCSVPVDFVACINNFLWSDSFIDRFVWLRRNKWVCVPQLWQMHYIPI